MKPQKQLYSLYKTLGLFICAMTFAPGAQAETTNCTAITSLPYTINTQGVYCFTGNLATSMTSGNVIDIQTNNVTLDLNGFKLGGLGAGNGTGATGIYASQRKNITIRNGIVRGFLRGIWLDDSTPFATSQGHVVEDILADQNTFSGIHVEGRGMTLRRNQLVDTGGGTSTSNAYGILVSGPGNVILNNDVTTTVARSGGNGHAYGIYTFQVIDGVMQNNRVFDTQGDGTGNGYGIYISSFSRVNVRDNTVMTAAYGVFYDTSEGIVRDNDTNNIATTKYTIVTDGGGNL